MNVAPLGLRHPPEPQGVSVLHVNMHARPVRQWADASGSHRFVVSDSFGKEDPNLNRRIAHLWYRIFR